MDNTIAGALAALIIFIVSVGAYLVDRLKRLEARDEQHDESIRKERDELKERVDALEAQIKLLKPLANRVPNLESQIETMTKSMADYQTRLETAEHVAEEKQGIIDDLTDKLRKERESNAKLTGKVETYENALKLLGQQIGKAKTEESEAGESSQNGKQPEEPTHVK